VIFFHKKKKKLIEKKQPNEASFFVSLVLTAGLFSPWWQWLLSGSAPASCSGTDPTQVLLFGERPSFCPSVCPRVGWHWRTGGDPGAEVSARWAPVAGGASPSPAPVLTAAPEPCGDEALRVKPWVGSFWGELWFHQPGAWQLSPPGAGGAGLGVSSRALAACRSHRLQPLGLAPLGGGTAWAEKRQPLVLARSPDGSSCPWPDRSPARCPWIAGWPSDESRCQRGPRRWGAAQGAP